MDLTVRVDTKPFELALRDVARQIPFAVSYAMNQTAKQTIPILRQDILHVFTVRNNWEAMGITFNAATKRDLSVEIGSRHDYMAAQVTGGVKKDKDGGHLGVPMVGRGLPRATIKSKTTPSRWPKAIIQQGATGFVGEANTKKGPMYGVWRRVFRDSTSGKITRRRYSDSRPGLKLLYTLPKSVKIPKRWPLQQQVVAVWNARWTDNTISAISHAFQTARERRHAFEQTGKWNQHKLYRP